MGKEVWQRQIKQVQQAQARDGVVREPGRANFVGSSLVLDRGVANAAGWLGIPPAAAWQLASTSVARIFDIELPILQTEF